MQNMPTHDIDKIDRAILRVLQKDGRVSNVQLADRVGLSESACLRRVRLLEQSGGWVRKAIAGGKADGRWAGG